jgi:hypothetical protein
MSALSVMRLKSNPHAVWHGGCFQKTLTPYSLVMPEEFDANVHKPFYQMAMKIK